MPVIRKANEIFEGVDVDGLIARFPYKEYGMSKSGDGSLTANLSDGTSVTLPAKALDYYAQVSKSESENPAESILPGIDSAVSATDFAAKANALKETARSFAEMEFYPEKYSFLSYVMSLPDMGIDSANRIRAAYSSCDDSRLSDYEKKSYSGALQHCLLYYKMLLGILAVSR